jgi:hypothetical protein
MAHRPTAATLLAVERGLRSQGVAVGVPALTHTLMSHRHTAGSITLDHRRARLNCMKVADGRSLVAGDQRTMEPSGRGFEPHPPH